MADDEFWHPYGLPSLEVSDKPYVQPIGFVPPREVPEQPVRRPRLKKPVPRGRRRS
jgi:hypothetical protein